MPSDVKLMPHKHPEDRIYTVMSGVFYIGLGQKFDGDKVQAYPPGSVIVLPGETRHFHWAKSGEYVTGDGNWSARSRIHEPEGRSAEQDQLISLTRRGREHSQHIAQVSRR